MTAHIVSDRISRTPAAQAGTAVKSAKKHVTPKWVDRLLIAILISIPVLYALGFSINKGPSMGNLGLVYKTSWGEQPTRVGQIVRFAPPDQPTWRKFLLPSIKRVAEIRKDGYFVKGDNSEQSQDSRDWGKVVPHNHVAGVVNWCWSPKRAWRARTAKGRFENNLEFSRSPETRKKLGRFWLVVDPDHFVVYNEMGVVTIKLDGKPVDNQSTNEQITYVPPDDGGRWWSVNLETGKDGRVKFNPAITMGFTKSSIGLGGDVTAFFPKGRRFLLDGVVVTTVRTEERQFGIFGVTTVVHFRPQLSRQPIVGTPMKLLE